MAMKFQREATHPFAITAYEAGALSVGGVAYRGSLMLSHQAAPQPWAVADFADLNETALTAAVALGAEIVLIGTGTRLRFPPTAALQPLRAAQIGFEVMDTAAACRTYNVLLAESRSVVAALVFASADRL